MRKEKLITEQNCKFLLGTPGYGLCHHITMSIHRVNYEKGKKEGDKFHPKWLSQHKIPNWTL